MGDPHSRQCAICNHPEREAIEQAFIEGESLRNIAGMYEFSHSSMARHVDYYPELKEKQEKQLLNMTRNLTAAAARRLMDRITEMGDGDAFKVLKLGLDLGGHLIQRTQEVPQELEGRSEAEVRFQIAMNRWPERDESQLYESLYGNLGYWPSRGEYEAVVRSMSGDQEGMAQ